MFGDDHMLKHQALLFWCNYIETGNINLSKEDAVNCGDTPQILSASQEKLVERLRSIAKEELQCSITQ